MPSESISALTDILREIAAYSGEDLKVDTVTFRATIPTSGSITQPTAEKLRSNYDYYLVGVKAGMNGVTVSNANLEDVVQINVNFKESGTGQDMFTSPIEMIILVDPSTGGSTGVLTFGPSGQKIRAGADLRATFERRAAIDLERYVAVTMVFALVPKNFHTRVPKLLSP